MLCRPARWAVPLFGGVAVGGPVGRHRCPAARRPRGRTRLTLRTGPARVGGRVPSEPSRTPLPTLDEAVRCPLLEKRQEEWIECCTARFLPLAKRVTGNHAEAEDVLQDAWIIAIEKVHQYKGQPPACGWIRTIVRREAKRAAARRKRDAPPDRREDDGDAEMVRPAAGEKTPEDIAHERQMLRLLLEIVDGLPPIYREVVKLRDFGGRSEGEAAVALGLSGSGAASRLHRAHRLVRDRLRRRLGQAGR